jgi:hypothetical protein
VAEAGVEAGNTLGNATIFPRRNASCIKNAVTHSLPKEENNDTVRAAMNDGIAAIFCAIASECAARASVGKPSRNASTRRRISCLARCVSEREEASHIRGQGSGIKSITILYAENRVSALSAFSRAEGRHFAASTDNRPAHYNECRFFIENAFS